MAFPAHHAGRSKRKEPDLAGPLLARSHSLLPAGGLGLLDRFEPATLLPDSGPVRRADCGACTPRLLRRAASSEPADGKRTDSGDSISKLRSGDRSQAADWDAAGASRTWIIMDVVMG